MANHIWHTYGSYGILQSTTVRVLFQFSTLWRQSPFARRWTLSASNPRGRDDFREKTGLSREFKELFRCSKPQTVPKEQPFWNSTVKASRLCCRPQARCDFSRSLLHSGRNIKGLAIQHGLFMFCFSAFFKCGLTKLPQDSGGIPHIVSTSNVYSWHPSAATGSGKSLIFHDANRMFEAADF